MSKNRFWQSLSSDVGFFERQTMNENAESISMMLDAQTYTAEHTGNQFRRLFELDHAQSKDLAQLRAIVRVLTEMVSELGIDRDRLEHRMEVALEELESEKTMTEGAAGGPYRGGGGAAAKAPEPDSKTVCESCSKTVLMRRTTITATGTVCDRCHFGT